MLTRIRRADGLSTLTPNDDEGLMVRSAAVVQAAGYRIVPLLHPIGPWGLLGVSGQDLLLVSVVREAWPSTLGGVWGHPPSFPVNTRRLIHCWTGDAALPEARSL